MKRGQLNLRAARAGLFLIGVGLQWWSAQSSSAIAFVGAFLLLLPGLKGIEHLARQLSRAYHPAAGWGLAVLAALLLNGLYGNLSFPGNSFLAGLFRSPVLGGNLAQLLANSLLVFWLLSFAQRTFHPPAYTNWADSRKSALSFLAYLTISLGLMWVVLLIRSLILDSGLQFDFRNIFNLRPLSLTGLASIVLLLFSLLLLSLWLGRAPMQLGLNRQQRLSAIAAALLASSLLMAILPVGISPLTGVLGLLLYLLLLDLFIELDAGSPAWLIVWLGLMATVGAAFSFKFKLDKDSQERLSFAQKLASSRDSLAEASLMALINSDTQLLRLVEQDGRTAERPSVEEKAEVYLLETYPYLGKNYRLQWDSTAFPAGQQLASGLYHLSPNSGYFAYAINLRRKGNGLLSFRPAIRPTERVLQETIPNNLARQAAYDLAVTFEDSLIVRRGATPEGRLLPAQWPPAGAWEEQVDSRYAVLHYHAPNGYLITVGEGQGGYLKPLSLFSYLFAMLLVAALLFFGISRYLLSFPATPPEMLIGEPSLRHRIQLAVIVLGMGAFIFIGLATIAYFRSTALQYHQERLLETVNVLVRSINLMEEPPPDALALNQLANTHKVDISLYRPDGQLLASSAPFLFRNRWKESRISPAALRALQERGFRPVVLDETVNDVAYKAAYVALPNKDGSPAYLVQIPYTATNQAMQENVVEFMGALFNFYVFLLLMGGALAIALANSITRPLAALGDKLRSFSLGPNEPLEWESPDEIGRLVQAYNQMVAKLEESAEKLRQSEREGAWREMAKQVAHEIKNPLTPMKLSIQYLQHARRSDPERAAALIDRVSKTLIEQIDGLAQIATEFSNFAKMPKPQNEHLVLNEVATSVYNLFTEHQEPAEDIQLILPEYPVPAFADKGQLIRVLNNLLKNAQQAIPEGRHGQIIIQLYQHDGNSIIKVSDNGSGIPEEVQPKVFEPNFTTKSSGMGLGLAMCKGMVEAAGGRLYFKTSKDEGTDFFVELPGLS
ncbi:MAG: HAMP domain-containing protein [Phaeodactylibacter sp.]|nr:HAMP domain-containing protein [Phaeodactylibacter sp.]MCB9048650.1 HAMP domain-containing protein [Lewinellaceae bacterium]